MTENSSGSTKLQKILARMNQESGFAVSVLTDSQGLVIASEVSEGMDAERQSAVVAFIQKSISQAAKQLGMANADEFSLYDENGQHLVCRPFKVNDHEFVIAVLIQERGISYRRVTNRVVREITQTWKEIWG